MSRRTLVPKGLDPTLTLFLDNLAKPGSAVSDLSGSAASSGTAVSTTAITAVATTATTQTSPYGFATQAQGDAVVSAINSLITRQASVIELINTLLANDATNSALIDAQKTTINNLLASLRAANKMDAS